MSRRRARRWRRLGALRGPSAALVLLVVAVAVVLWPARATWTTALVGDADSDVLRGLWTTQLLRHQLGSPGLLHTTWAGFPGGVTGLALPWASLVLGWLVLPLGDAVAWWNAELALLLVLAGLASAALAREVGGSWAAGAVVGAWMVSQPMLLHAVADGTLEHVALWGLAGVMAAGLGLLRLGAVPWAVAVGVLAAVVALDSPYFAVAGAVVATVLAPSLVPRLVPVQGRGGRRRWLAPVVAVAGVAAAAVCVAALYRGAPVDVVEATSHEPSLLRGTNATDLMLWRSYAGTAATSRDPTQPPTALSLLLLPGALVVLVRRRWRGAAGPWLAAGLVLVVLSLGTRAELPSHLAGLGAPGIAFGRLVRGVNGLLLQLPGLEHVRFPRRLLVPAALCLAMSLAVVLGPWMERMRPGRRWVLAVLLGGLVLADDLRVARWWGHFPRLAPPRPTFTTFLATAEGPGAVLLLPHTRPVEVGATRETLPVFAEVSDLIRSADGLWFQVLHGRPQVGAPDLKTLQAAPYTDAEARLLADWSDLARPGLGFGEPPGSALDPGQDERRLAALDAWIAQGLRFLVLDAKGYDAAACEELRRQLGDRLEDERDFEDGTGVRVWTIGPGRR